jgi:hypothetical protein
MNVPYRLTIEDLLASLLEWDNQLHSKVFVAACGGTALTLYGYKESTKDVDFLVPIPAHYKQLLSALKALGYREATGKGYKHPNHPWIFDLFDGQHARKIYNTLSQTWN